MANRYSNKPDIEMFMKMSDEQKRSNLDLVYTTLTEYDNKIVSLKSQLAQAKDALVDISKGQLQCGDKYCERRAKRALSKLPDSGASSGEAEK